MANFSLEDVKVLRERLGTGMVDTKNALVEADGDIEKAVEILRLKGAKGNAKRADRSTSEGLIAVVESATAVTMIELACESCDDWRSWSSLALTCTDCSTFEKVASCAT